MSECSRQHAIRTWKDPVIRAKRLSAMNLAKVINSPELLHLEVQQEGVNI